VLLWRKKTKHQESRSVARHQVKELLPWMPCPPENDVTRRIGKLLWAGEAVFNLAPPCDFFPRSLYGAVMLPAAPGRPAALLLMGGIWQDRPMNDIWRLTIPQLGARGSGNLLSKPRWTRVSPHTEASINESGKRIWKKWPGRLRFGLCASRADGGGMLVHVAGGGGAGSSFGLNDVWASEDGGTNWICMTQAAPWCRRHSPGLYSVPRRPDHLLLVGGMANDAEICKDVWTSDDAGHSWAILEEPPWGFSLGRCRPALLPLGAEDCDEPSTVRVLMLGGCFSDDPEGGCFSLERLMHDAWECHLDLSASPARWARANDWRPWGSSSDQQARMGVENATCTWDPGSNQIIAKLPAADFVSTFSAERPSSTQEALPWQQSFTRHMPKCMRSDTWRGPASPSAASIYVRIASTTRQAVPRLVIANSEAVLISDETEWYHHARFVLLLGVRLGHAYDMPGDLWRGRVLPAVLPTVLSTPPTKRS